MHWLAARSWRFWVVVASLPVLYVTSIGPACRLVEIGLLPRYGTAVAYTPILMAASRSWIVFNSMKWYAGLFTDPRSGNILWQLCNALSLFD
jgi:hypothetical protein